MAITDRLKRIPNNWYRVWQLLTFSLTRLLEFSNIENVA